MKTTRQRTSRHQLFTLIDANSMSHVKWRKQSQLKKNSTRFYKYQGGHENRDEDNDSLNIVTSTSVDQVKS